MSRNLLLLIRLNHCSYSLLTRRGLIHTQHQIHSIATSCCCSKGRRLLQGWPLNVFDKRERFSSTYSKNYDVIPFLLSDIGEGIREVTIKEWFVKEGDSVSEFDPLCEVQSDKASVTITSRFDGLIHKLCHEVDGVAKTGEALVEIQVTSVGSGSAHEADDVTSHEVTEVRETSCPEQTNEPQNQLRIKTAIIPCTPAVRRIATEHNVNLKDVTATGKDGRVLKEDILAYIEEDKDEATSPPKSQKSRNEQSVQATKISNAEEPFNAMRRAMCTSMTESLKIPHFGYHDEYNVSNLVSLRSQLKDGFERESKSLSDSGHKVKLTYLPFIVKAVSMSLDVYSILNASVDFSREMISYNTDHNISIAVDSPHGLIVPNVKAVQCLSVRQIASEISRLTYAASKGKLRREDLENGTFAISNIGSLGTGRFASPVIPPGLLGIGAFCRIEKRVVVSSGNGEERMGIADIMGVSWSGDHRVIDGATMIRFSGSVKSLLETPAKMCIDLK